MAIKLGELLVHANVISEGQLKAALSEQQKWGGKLGEILARMEYCSEEVIVRALAKQLGLQRVDLDRLAAVSESVLSLVPVQLARDLDIMPLQLRDDGKTLVVALSDPLNIETLDALRARTGCRIVPLLAGSTALARARARFYEGEADLDATAADSPIHLTDALGRTVSEVTSEGVAAAAPPAVPRRAPPKPQPPASPAPDPNLLDALEATQRKETAAVKAMIELLIEKGVFTRDELLARIQR